MLELGHCTDNIRTKQLQLNRKEICVSFKGCIFWKSLLRLIPVFNLFRKKHLPAIRNRCKIIVASVIKSVSSQGGTVLLVFAPGDSAGHPHNFSDLLDV